MQIVYVLVSDEKDLYLEQCLVSVTSLKKRMPNCHITLLIDNKTSISLQGKRSLIKRYIENIVEVDFLDEIQKKERSRYLKTSMRKNIKGDFLFIDCDTVVCEDLQQIERYENNLYAVMDNHTPLNKNVYARDMVLRAKKCGFYAAYNNIHFNSGVLWVKDTQETRKFFELWHALWIEGKQKGILSDQLSFNEANCRMNGFISELNGIWNCQVDFGIKYLYSAKIIHYLGFNPKGKKNEEQILPYRMSSRKLLNEIKVKGTLSDEVLKIIDEPKGEKAFYPSLLINNNRVDVKIMFGSLISCLRVLYRKLHFLYKLLDYIVCWIRNIWLHQIKKEEV